MQLAYIKALKEKYNPTITAIANMMGVERANLSKHLLKLGFEKQERGQHPWDKTGFSEWCFGMPKTEECPKEEVKEVTEVELAVAEEEISVQKEERFVEIPNPGIKVNFIKEDSAPAFATPMTGSMTLEGNIKGILNTLLVLLGASKVKMTVSWEVCNDR